MEQDIDPLKLYRAIKDQDIRTIKYILNNTDIPLVVDNIDVLLYAIEHDPDNKDIIVFRTLMNHFVDMKDKEGLLRKALIEEKYYIINYLLKEGIIYLNIDKLPEINDDKILSELYFYGIVPSPVESISI